MKLHLTLGDKRPKQYSGDEEYTRAAIEGAEANPKVIAAMLRGIADEIDPPRVNAASSVQFQPGGTIR